MRTAFAILAVFAASAIQTQAAVAKGQENQAFAALDRNSDGSLGRDEAAAEKELAIPRNSTSTAVSVETYEGRVQLSGFVDK